MEKPNPDGVFHAPVARGDLVGLAGGAKEPYGNVAKRVLFLLESKWLSSETANDTLLDEVVATYSDYVKSDPTKHFVFLLNDVIRFFRSLCVNYHFTTDQTPDGKWPIRNIKLRHSRVLMYFSMIAAIGCLSKERSAQKVEALLRLVAMPPLKRLFVAYAISDDYAFAKVAAYYNTFLHTLSNAEHRRELMNLEYADRYASPIFSQLKGNSDALSSELLRFFDARRGHWDDRFFEYMVL